MTGRALIRSDKFRARNARRRHDRVVRLKAAAGKQDERECAGPAGSPPEVLTSTNEPTEWARVAHGSHSGKKP
jgi:hypothetical protein